jgi:hypothetical protein
MSALEAGIRPRFAPHYSERRRSDSHLATSGAFRIAPKQTCFASVRGTRKRLPFLASSSTEPESAGMATEEHVQNVGRRWLSSAGRVNRFG